MCGFIGVFHKDPHKIANLNEISQTLELEKRGPDETSFFCDRNFAIKFYRLSIVGGSNGKQPLHDNEDLIAFNGEIYNYKDISNYSKSDTHVLFNLLKQRDFKTINKLKGMYAFVHWNKKANSLVFGRDFWGKKPLFYISTKETIFFSSSINALSKNLKNKTLDRRYLEAYFTYGYSILGGTPFTSIKEAPSGEIFFPINNKSIKINPIKNYNKYKNLSSQDVVFECRRLLEEIIKRKAHSCSSLYLSGGIDSTIVKKLLKINQKDFKTFTLNFENYNYNEDVHIKNDDNHKDIFVSKAALVNAVNKTLAVDGNLHANPANIGFYLLSEESKEYSPVALTGGGGDEIFFGYPTWKGNFYSNFSNKLSENNKKFISVFLNLFPSNLDTHSKLFALKKVLSLEKGDFHKRHFYWRTLQSRITFNRIFKKSNYGLDFFQNKNFTVKELGLIDLNTWWKNMGLRQADIFGMINGIEVRSFYCDEDLLNFSYSINIENHKPLSSKSILIKVAKSLGIFQKSKKKPFTIPLHQIYSRKNYLEITDEFYFSCKKTGIDFDLDYTNDIIYKNFNDNLFFLHMMNNFNAWTNKIIP